MSRSAKFWLWSFVSIVLFIIDISVLRTHSSISPFDAFLYSFIGVILLWIIGLRILIGGKKPLPAKKLRNPYLATPDEFEMLCAAIFTRKGYKTELTPKGGDYGIDVIARKGKSIIVIGAKCYAPDRPVGNRWVQQLLGAMHRCDADSAVLIATSTFTQRAKEQANNAPIELIDGEDLKKIIRRYWL